MSAVMSTSISISNGNKDKDNVKAASTGLKTYCVKERDSLRSIAVTYNTTTSALLKMNKMLSSYVYPGQVIKVPCDVDEEDVSALATENICSSVNPTSMEDAYSFLAPLSPSASKTSTPLIVKPFQDLVMVSSSEQRSDCDVELKKFSTSSSQNGISEAHSLGSEFGRKISCEETEFTNNSRNNSANRERMISIDSCASETFEENFLKMNVHYISPLQSLVRGVLLVTPTSVMFDPDPSDPLAAKYGCDKFGIMCNISSVSNVTMFNDVSPCKRTSTSSSISDATKLTTLSDNGVVDAATDRVVVPKSPSCNSTSPDLVDLTEDFTTENNGEVASSGIPPSVDAPESAQESDNKLMFEFPLLHSIVKTVEDYLPGIVGEPDDCSNSTTSNLKEFMYLCIRSEMPMMKTFSLLTSLNESPKKDGKGSEEINEGWFQVPRRRSDQLLAFFMQWNPDPYMLDFAEQNGFIVADSLEEDKGREIGYNEDGNDEKFGSSTNTSLEFIEDFFADSKMQKEWEIVSVEEARRRSTLNIMDLANDDASLVPDMLNTSNLLTDESLLALCKHLPARSIGYPWKLLYSTFEHGISLRTLYRKMNVRSEESPAIVIVQDSDNHIFGAFCSSRPCVSEHFCGTGESFLFTLEPNIQFFDWSGENNFFVKGDPDSLTFGGGDGSSGLWLDGELCHGSTHKCLTYNNDILASNEDFFIQGVEVWGFSES